MTLLLTGGTGYLGSRLARMLVDDGHDLVLLKRSTSDCSRLSELPSAVRMFDADRMALPAIFDQAGPVSAVIHTATCYGRNQETSPAVCEANTLFPLRLLDAAVHAGVTRFINTDSGLPPQVSPYALSKHQFAEWGRFYAQEGRISFINLKLEHFFGPDDDASKFTTHLIRGCMDNRAEIPLTAGEQLRDFIHIDDVVAAYRCLISRLDCLEAGYADFGVGSGEPVKIREFAELVRDLTASATHLAFGVIPYRRHEVMKTCADISGLVAQGWRPCMTLAEGLADTIAEERKKGQ